MTFVLLLALGMNGRWCASRVTQITQGQRATGGVCHIGVYQFESGVYPPLCFFELSAKHLLLAMGPIGY